MDALRPGGAAASARQQFSPPERPGAAAGVRTVRSMLRTRVPVAKPNPTSTWEDEVWRLRRLYDVGAGCFSVAEQGGGGRRLRLVHHCTDPDWEAVNWAPEGLALEVDVPASYPERIVSADIALRVVGPEGLPERFVQIVPQLFAESLSQAAPSTPAVYRALQHVDRHLAGLWLKLRAAARGGAAPAAAAAAEARRCVQLAPKTRSDVEPWTAEEQARLDAALAEFRGEADAKKRWAAIASRVGGARTAKDCADRFKASRAPGGAPTVPVAPAAGGGGASSSAAPPPPPPPAPEQGAAPEQQQAQAMAAAFSADEVRRLGAEVRLVGLALEGFATLLPSSLRLQVVCGRCRKPTELESEGAGTQPRSVEAPCPVCRQKLEVRVAPTICHGGCVAIAHVLGVGCHPVQFFRGDFTASCGDCTESVRVRNVGPGYRKRSNCTACHAKLNLAVEGAEVIGATVAHWRQIAAEEGDRLNERRRLQHARRSEREMGIRVGQPLPHQGACKHFMKSYRWLRFPCCGRAFPCDDCHDEQSDHPYEWANRMLCGYCSFEQLAAKDRCGNCGKGTTRARTAFWEGGEGCRNRAAMSRNDTHKYSGLGKCVSKKAVAKSSK